MILRTLLALLLASLAAPLAAQTCPLGNPQVAPDSRYEILTPVAGEGVVRDKNTGLEWKRCAEGQSGATCTGSASTMNWGAALAVARGSTWAGHGDWRLPNIEELRSLVETGCHSPAINTWAFPSTPSSYFWSSTTYVPSASSAWFVGFDYGYLVAYDKSTNQHVRLVRGGQWLDTFSLDYAAGPNGSLSGDTSQSVPPGGDGTAVTALPDLGYHFVNWSDSSTDNPRTDTNVQANVSVTANFAINQYTLTFDSHGGSVVDPIEADFGETVALPGAPTYPGYVFVHWNSGADGAGTAWAPGDPFIVGAQDEVFHAIWRNIATAQLIALPNPTRRNEWVELRTEVTGSISAPADGQVVVSAGAGSDCTSSTPETTVDNVAIFACAIRFPNFGVRTVTAQFSGSTTHADASSNPVELKIMRFADLSITADDGEGDVAVGDVLSYLLEVRNAGPDDAPGSQVLATVAPLLDGQNWTCSPVGSASCPAASGTGSIAETVDMPANSGLDFTLEGEITGTPTEILLDASVVPDADAPNYVHDPVPGNNQAQDRDTVAPVFADGFEEEL